MSIALQKSSVVPFPGLAASLAATIPEKELYCDHITGLYYDKVWSFDNQERNSKSLINQVYVLKKGAFVCVEIHFKIEGLKQVKEVFGNWNRVSIYPLHNSCSLSHYVLAALGQESVENVLNSILEGHQFVGDAKAKMSEALSHCVFGSTNVASKL